MPAQVANHSAGFDLSCPFTELAIIISVLDQGPSVSLAVILVVEVSCNKLIFTHSFMSLNLIVGYSKRDWDPTSKEIKWLCK